MTRIKICGITRQEDAETAAELGADAIGMILSEGDGGKIFDRYISKSSERIKSNADGEPISDLCVKVAEKCLSDLNLKKS